MYNMMTCSGFDTGFMGGCSIAWLGTAVVFFAIMIAGKYLEDSITFHKIWGVAVGLILYIVLVTITGEAKWGILIGLIGGFIGGYLLGQFFGEEGGGY